MRIIDWIAILGALAWTPHLAALLRQWITKPKVRVLTDKFAEIGFTTFGPIFNLRLAFSVENKDIVVSDLRIHLKHEGGDQKTFSWQGITQHVGKMTMPDSNVMPFEKEQSVLAIKLNGKEIEERFIRFQDAEFIAKRQTYIDRAAKKMIYLKSEDKYDSEAFLREPEMIDLYRFNRHAFPWKAGKYEIAIEVSSPVKFNIIDQRREFILTPLDVEKLTKNQEVLEKDYRRIVLGSVEKESGIQWEWVTPSLLCGDGMGK